MDNDDANGRGFLKELAPEAVLTATIMRRPAEGPQEITRVIHAVADRYALKTPLFEGSIEGRVLVGYKANLISGEEVYGLITIIRSEDGLITRLNVSYSPLPGVLALSKAVGQALGPDFSGMFFE